MYEISGSPSRSWKWGIPVMIYICFNLIGCVQPGTTVSDSSGGIATTDLVYVGVSKAEIIDALVNRSMSTGLSVIETNDHLVVAEGLDKSFGARFLYGSKYDRVPALRVRYNVANVGAGNVRVQGRAEMITNPGSAFERADDVTGEMANYISTQLYAIQKTQTVSSLGVNPKGNDSQISNLKTSADRVARWPTRSDLEKLPSDAGGVSLRYPDVTDNGNVVPFFADFSRPVLAGDRVVITSDGESALMLDSNEVPISGISSRVRLRIGTIGVYVLRKDGTINSATGTTVIRKAADQPPHTGNSGTSFKKATAGNELKLLFSNDMAQNGHLRKIEIRTGSDNPISVLFTTGLSANPYLSIKSGDNLKNAQVLASI